LLFFGALDAILSVTKAHIHGVMAVAASQAIYSGK